MIRTLVQLTEAQMESLRELAAARGVSVSELVRQGVDLVLSGATRASRRELRARAAEVSGKFSSGLGDLSTRHDKYLREDFAR
jgi:hypothetical protein